MAQTPFHYLDFRTFCYATEDASRVEQALRTFIPDDISIDRSTTEGHHGDRILILVVRVERAAEIRDVLNRILETATKAHLEATVADRMDDECAFFVRFDKQEAYQGNVALGKGIELRGKVEAYPASRDAAIENLAAYLAAQ